MKRLHLISKFLFFILVSTLTAHAQIGIGTTTPNPNAALDVESTTQGVLIPRMLKAQRELIGGGAPAAGMLVYQTDDVAGFYFYNGTAWVSLSAKTPSGLETVDEGNGNGLVKVERTPANYGNVGMDAVDLSHSDFENTTNGATGNYSTAMGFNTKASAYGSTAMGIATTAIGQYSTAMGFSTAASGVLSTAMGYSTAASGLLSTAMGYFSIASGSYSTAMGFQTEASGSYSTALGEGTQAESLVSTALGRYNVGGGNPALFAATDPLFEIGNGTSGSNRSNALTVLKNGTVTAPSFDISEITDDKALITKEYAEANLKSSGMETVNEGNGNGIVRVGRNPANYGNVGLDAVDFSFSNNASTTNGATGVNSTAMGFNTKASEFDSTAMGNSTTASGSASTAMGERTTASGLFSTAMGYYSIASGSYSTAMGLFTTASGNLSTALGERTQAESYASTALGRYNVGGGNPSTPITTDPLFEIGNGTSDSNRSNALTVLKNGNVGIGKTDPLQALDVVGSTAITDNLQVDNTTLFVNSVTNRVGIGTPIPLQALSVVGNAEVTGNLGIGTASPIAKLDVNGNAYVNGNVGIGATNPSQALDVVGNAEINGAAIVTNNLQVDNTTLFVNASNNRVGIGTTDPLQALSVVGNAEVTGNLGIGTASPIAKLDVNGDIFANGHVYGNRIAFTGFQDTAVDLQNINSPSTTLSLAFTDVTDNFNTLNSGVFTAPRSGLYFFSCSLSFSDGDGQDDTMWFGFSVNGSSSMSTESIFNPRTYTGSGREQAYSHSAVISLNVGNTVEVLIRDISASSPVKILNRTFTGYYLGRN